MERIPCCSIGFFLPVPAPSSSPTLPSSQRPTPALPGPDSRVSAASARPSGSSCCSRPSLPGPGGGPEGRGSRADFNPGVLGTPRPTALGAAILLRLCNRKGPVLSCPTHRALSSPFSCGCSVLLKAHALFTLGLEIAQSGPLRSLYNRTLAFPSGGGSASCRSTFLPGTAASAPQLPSSPARTPTSLRQGTMYLNR